RLGYIFSRRKRRFDEGATDAHLFVSWFARFAPCALFLAFNMPAADAAQAHARTSTDTFSTGIPGVEQGQLSPDFWIAHLRRPDRVALDAAAITRRNALMTQRDESLHDLASLPQALDGARLSGWLMRTSRRPATTLFDEAGRVLDPATLDAIVANANLQAIPAQQPTRYGLAVRRASLRTFPTAQRVFSSTGDTDLDRFQESALFPATPVVIAHVSRDGNWWFVITPTYAAWVPKSAIAEASRSQVLDYIQQRPARLVTGAIVRTTTTPENPHVSNLQLDMGVRLPLATISPDSSVNGQHPGASWAVLVPVRNDSGGLALAPALIPRPADTAAASLPLTPANTIRQAFKFLGERYGWGEDYDARDCSGFVSAVFASMGVVLPRNTSDQARNPAFTRLHLDPTSTRAARLAAVRGLQVGDLVYLPGHVMLVIGRFGGVPYVIHDIHDGKVIDKNGALQSMHLNGVVVTPLPALRLDASHDFVEGITDVVQMLDGAARPDRGAP
ncbi:MAG TPA: SH3 domain-containing protein, partial [Luteimonas sp.]|nr:SH3 domain-containing protein [Luteimonas sp.]